MKVRINKIYSKGDYQKECVVLKILEDCDMGRHLLSRAGYSNDRKEFIRCKQAYWFPDQEVKKGDFVWLYTRAAKDGEQDCWSSGPKSTTYTFFWGLATEVWNNGADAVVITEAKTWTGRFVREV